MDKVLFELEHTIIALLITVLFIYIKHSLEGFIIVTVMFITREQTQAEYRWIEKFGQGKRKNMPWWGQLDYRVWDLHSLLFNMLLPIIASMLLIILLA
jgi:hypothetical protein